MVSTFKRYILPTLLILVLGAGLGLTVDSVISDEDPYEELKKLEDAFLLINGQYVEDVNPGTLAESAIEAMLQELDPHSSYINAEQMKDLQQGYQGSFGGIGIWFEAPPEDSAKVTSTFPDAPGERIGMMPGDRMIAVDDTSIVGMGSLDIQDRIKGPVGTDVKITVIRPGTDEPIDFVITRANIPLYSIDAGYMVDERTGYIKVGRFAITTHDEFVEHLGRLKAQGMDRLILDLRGNPGGIKTTAVQMADEMLGGQGVIVSTEGRNPRENEVDRITPGGLMEDGPVIVLVDENSASGSEIVAGALQDHDRALIVGRRTFGKGLVQRPFQLRDGSVIQMTVARYYMPSGRLIQTPYETGELDKYYEDKFSDYEDATFDPAHYLADLPDSLRYETLHGRTVFGGGGVMPDMVVAPDSTSLLASPLVGFMLRGGQPFLYVRDWFDRDGSALRERWDDDHKAEFMESFDVDGALWNDYIDWTRENGLTIGAEMDESEGVFTASELARTRSVVEVILKARIAQRLYRSEAWYPVYNTIDPTIREALKMWNDAEMLSANHRPGAPNNG